MSTQYYQCVKCKWSGEEWEKFQKPITSGPLTGLGKVHICPRCGHDEFYKTDSLVITKPKPETARLDFLIENRFSVQQWHRSGSQQIFYVINEREETIAEGYTGREAIDNAIKEMAEQVAQ